MQREPLIELLLLVASRPSPRCLHQSQRAIQQTRSYISSSRLCAVKSATTGPPPSPSKLEKDPLLRPRKAAEIPVVSGDRTTISRIPVPKRDGDENFVPAVLSRPLGLRSPPEAGENSPVDRRTLRQKRQDFEDSERAKERRKLYLRTFLRPYYQEWTRVRHHDGKSFVSNPRLFKKEKALYFPNIWGQTLAKEGDGPDGGRDTTPILRGKVSVVGIQSGQWAEEQLKTFVGTDANPRLQELFKQNKDKLQRVDINVQGDVGRAWLVRLFSSGLRRTLPGEQWTRYFMVKLPRDVRRGLTDDVRDAMGFLNTQVGYVYLLDEDCKIRWAGSGPAWDGEVDGLNGGVERLLEEYKQADPTVKQDKETRKEMVTRISPFGGLSTQENANAAATG